jgi:S1-C subfamily serine protease
MLIVLLSVPPFLEQITYHMTRGRVQAARDSLGELTPTSFGNTSRLVSEAIQQSVVYISTHSDHQKRGIPHATGQGSGVVIDEEGYLLTNFHVVDGASKLFVHFGENRQAQARLVGFDKFTDLAVLKIDANNLVAANWGDSGMLAQGDPVWAIGSPYGLDNSVSFGIISALNRESIGNANYPELLQTDAAVNPGNSGGALVNAHGELVGINTAIVGTAYRGISFAIPSNTAREVFRQIKEHGEIARGWLGVRLAKLPSDLARQTNLTRGVLIVGVLEYSPAAIAKIERGDIVTAWQGKPVTDPTALRLLVAQTPPQTEAAVTILRNHQSLKLNVKLGQIPHQLH